MTNNETAAATKGDIKQLIGILDRRFHSVDQKLESHDARFESIDERFTSIDERLNSLDRKIDRTKDSLILYIEGAKTQLSSQIDALGQKVDSIDYKLSRRIDLLEARC